MNAPPITTTNDEDTAKLNVLVQRTRELEGELAGLRDQLWRAKGRPSKLVAMVMLLVGSITLVSSAVYDVTVLAFIGMGLTFWGALLLQIRPARFVHVEIVGSTAQSMMIAIDRLVGEQGNVGKATYLPGDDLEATTVFLPLNGGGPTPTTHLDSQYLTKGRMGMSLVPPGLSLASLLDEQIGNISKGGVATLGDRLTSVLTENLEIAKRFEMSIQTDRIQVKFQDSIYSELYDELRESTQISSRLGCPICSAIACLLTKTTSRPVTFEGEMLSKNGRMMESSYQILNESVKVAGGFQTEPQNQISKTMV
jgi:hypothetical protein